MSESIMQEVEFDDIGFYHEGVRYIAVGSATHICKLENYGIGSYEFWGMRGNDKRSGYFSDGSQMEISIDVYDENNKQIENPSKEMIDSSIEYIFDKTHERAEERCE